MNLDEYQRRAHESSRTDDIDVFTLGLFGEAGSVASSIKKLTRENVTQDLFKSEVATELGDVLWYLSEIATHFGISLSEIAELSIRKSQFLFKGSSERLDLSAPPDQRFPEKISLTFEPSGSKLQILINGRPFGDKLDDNAHDEDGYRFHDIFHFAYMTKLGWSPVIRSQLNLKRRYDPNIDRIEDGARSRFLQEGISVFVFNQNMRSAEGISTFSDRRNIPFSVLSGIKIMTRNVEVRNRDITAWRDAIEIGFQMFDKLERHNGGRIACNLKRRTMRFSPP